MKWIFALCAAAVVGFLLGWALFSCPECPECPPEPEPCEAAYDILVLTPAMARFETWVADQGDVSLTVEWQKFKNELIVVAPTGCRCD